MNEYYDALFFYHDVEANRFFDQCGKKMDTILEVITPNDLYLFRKDPEKFHKFIHRYDRRIMCLFLKPNGGPYDDE